MTVQNIVRIVPVRDQGLATGDYLAYVGSGSKQKVLTISTVGSGQGRTFVLELCSYRTMADLRKHLETAYDSGVEFKSLVMAENDPRLVLAMQYMNRMLEVLAGPSDPFS